MTDARLQALKTIEKGAPVPGSADSGVIEFVDEWPPLAIGKFNASGLSNMITESTRFVLLFAAAVTLSFKY